jgi:hypothetical protein
MLEYVESCFFCFATLLEVNEWDWESRLACHRRTTAASRMLMDRWLSTPPVKTEYVLWGSALRVELIQIFWQCTARFCYWNFGEESARCEWGELGGSDDGDGRRGGEDEESQNIECVPLMKSRILGRIRLGNNIPDNEMVVIGFGTGWQPAVLVEHKFEESHSNT